MLLISCYPSRSKIYPKKLNNWKKNTDCCHNNSPQLHKTQGITDKNQIKKIKLFKKRKQLLKRREKTS